MHDQPHPILWNGSFKSRLTVASPACDDCFDPICSPTELTSQCTDQCVVVPCNGMSDATCPADIRCDFVCDGVDNCTDCSGFDNFLQCCNDYHPGFSEPRSLDSIPTAPISWDFSLDEFLCECGTQIADSPVIAQSSASSSSPQMVSYNEASAPVVLRPSVPAAPETQPPLLTSPTSTEGSSVTVPEPVLSCMWATCQACFRSLSELVGHVNLEHLRLPSNSTFCHPERNNTPELNMSSLSCQWRDCNAYPSVGSIPNSSSGDPVNDLLHTLAYHLLRDHLGFNVPSTTLQSAPHPMSSQLVPTESKCIAGSPSPNKCDDNHSCLWKSCDGSFKTFDDLTTHITSMHIGGGKAHYECFWEKCNRNGHNGFSSKQKICRHMQSHTGHRPHQCNICHQNFSEAATLQQHMRRHTQEKPYKCDHPGCGKSFAITGALTIHKRIHNGLKPFKCKYCDKAFAESSNLSKHLRTHTGVRPYPCLEPSCNKSFARPDQLNRHSAVHRKKLVESAKPS